jgi:hypothetical protein
VDEKYASTRHIKSGHVNRKVSSVPWILKFSESNWEKAHLALK